MGRTLRTLAAIGCSALCFCARAGLPALPGTFERTGRTDESGTSWRESGEMATSLSNAVESLSASFSEQGYVLVHDIGPSDGGGSARIQFWAGPETNLLVMLQRLSDERTGVRWGPTGKEGDEIAAEPSGTADASAKTGDGGERVPISLSVGLMLTWFWMMASGVFALLFLVGLVRTWIRRRRETKK